MPTISGVITDSTGANAQRVVRVYLRDSGTLVGAALSDPTTGAYSITTPHGGEHFVLAHDTNQAFDPHWASVVLACHFDGTNGSTTFIDEKGKTLTASGSAQISTAQSKFGGASGYFAGGANRVITPDHADLHLGNNDFTIEAWLYPTVLDANGRAFVSQANNVANNVSRQFACQIFNNKIAFYWTTDGQTDQSVNFTCSPVLNTWQHVEFCRTGGMLYGFLNGTLLGSVSHTPTYFDSTADLCIGTFGKYAENGFSTLSFNGYMDELRITRGVARHTASFTPIASAFLQGISGGTENAIILDRVVPV
jgi:hypothetical protein